MIGPDDRVLLDTNIVGQLVRWRDAGRAIDTAYRLTSRPEAQLICGVTLGKCESLARQWKLGADKFAKLRELLKKLVVIDIEIDVVVRRYAEIDHFSRVRGRPMGKNDVWIAAAAVAADATLLTTDGDFDHLVESAILRRERFVLPDAN